MKIYPAIDIHNGQCVRLKQGNFNESTIYNKDPLVIAEKWVNLGTKYMHIVDLDGACQGNSQNSEIIKRIADKFNVEIQVGGGIRSIEDIDKKIEMGVSRVIIGTAAIKDPQLVKQAVVKYGDKIIVGIDAKDGYVAIEGWKTISNMKAVDLGKQMKEFGVKTIIYTDISKDGMLSGPNIKYTKQLKEQLDLNIIASGGVTNMDDLYNLHENKIDGVIIGKALYTKNIDLSEVLKIF